MYRALYRKWRPAVFSDVVGQDHITSVLRSEVDSGKLSHAYLFCGPRGTGKTTCAKIIAKAANCEHPENGNPCGKCHACLSVDSGNATDVIEMDAASNNGVDAIRDIRDAVVYTPSELRYRVYIIDEVHMLSIAAFNALLKTLEEPPEHVLFILATTELHKIPATVLSRCQRFDFHRISPESMIARLKTVCEGEGFTADEGSLSLITRLSQGAMRDALNMLEYCASDGGVITVESASRMLGAASGEMLGALASSVSAGDVTGALTVIDDIYQSSRDIAVFWRELISFYRDMLIFLSTKGRKNGETLAASYADRYSVPRLFAVLEACIAAESNMQKWPLSSKLYAEMALISACDADYASPAPVQRPASPGTPGNGKAPVFPAPGNAKASDSPASASPTSASPTSVAPPATASPSPAKEVSASVTGEEEIPMGEAPPAGNEKEASAVDAPAPPGTDPKASAPAGRKDGKRPLRRFGDVLRQIETFDRPLSSFLRGTLAMEDGTRLYLILEQKFAVKLMTDDRKRVISEALLKTLGLDYPIERIICTTREDTADSFEEPIESLIAKMEEFEGED